ncbi:MAG: hypothetical protein IKP73_04140 [Bacteroidales bacterium]|nr:hypothetical protein [Bacteroidales bacterium]
MQTETIKVTSDAGNQDVVLVMKRRKFPWWIFLLLLPLILLIPIPREIKLQFVNGDGNTPVSGKEATISYPVLYSFGVDYIANTVRTTDGEGKIVIDNVKEPLWFRLFPVCKDSLQAGMQTDCGTAGRALLYKDVPRDKFLVITLQSLSSGLTIKVIDSSNGKPLPGAKVVIGNKEYITDDAATIKTTLPHCSDLKAVANKEGYTGDSLSIIGYKPKTSPDERTLKLTPIKKEEPKPDPPKPDPPKKQDPPKPDPPKQDDLKGKTGDLRFNLQWYCKADLDMIIKDPCGRLTYYDRKRTSCNGSTGILDIDANQDATNHPERASTSPQENTVWTNPSNGNYTVIIKCCPFHPRMNLPSKKIKFTLTIIDKNGRIDKTGQIGENDSLIFTTHTLR